MNPGSFRRRGIGKDSSLLRESGRGGLGRWIGGERSGVVAGRGVGRGAFLRVGRVLLGLGEGSGGHSWGLHRSWGCCSVGLGQSYTRREPLQSDNLVSGYGRDGRRSRLESIAT